MSQRCHKLHIRLNEGAANLNYLCNINDLLAEGEELGSNLLHVGQSTPSSCVPAKGAAKAAISEPKVPSVA